MAQTHRESLERMVTKDRAARVAAILFPANYLADPEIDCRQEHGREGKPCNICAAKRAAWAGRIVQVREAMIEAFR